MTTTTSDRLLHIFRLTPALALRWSSLSIILFVVTAAAISTFTKLFMDISDRGFLMPQSILNKHGKSC